VFSTTHEVLEYNMEITKLDLLALTTAILVFGPMWWEGIQVMLSW
jgi:hypothetical protein